MKFIYSYKEIAKLIGKDLTEKGLHNRETQEGYAHPKFKGQDIDYNFLEFHAEVVDKEEPKEEYEPGDWKEEENAA